MFLPFVIKVKARKKIMRPIIEVITQCDANISIWIDFPIALIEKGEAMGGRLLPNELNQKLDPNTVSFTMTFENERNSKKFLDFLMHR